MSRTDKRLKAKEAVAPGDAFCKEAFLEAYAAATKAPLLAFPCDPDGIATFDQIVFGRRRVADSK